jgi:hypothetical protein
VISSVWFSPDYTRTASGIAENCVVMPSLWDASLVVQRPSPLAGEAEGVWLDCKHTIHPITSDYTIGVTLDSKGAVQFTICG